MVGADPLVAGLAIFVLLASDVFSPRPRLGVAAVVTGTLSPTQRPLSDGQSLVSAGGTFELGFFSPNRSTYRYVGIWYHTLPVQTVVWVANRRNPITSTNGTLSITSNGTLVISDELNSAVVLWSSTSSSSSPAGRRLVNPVAQLLDNGNFVVREANGSSGSTGGDAGGVAWQSFDHPTDTLLADMKLGVDLRTGLVRNFTSWASESDPSPGNFTLAFDLHGYPQVFLWEGQSAHWRGGPWNGRKFTGTPELDAQSIYTDYYVANSDEVYYTYKLQDPSFFPRLIVKPDGITGPLVWINRTNSWSAYTYVPRDVCDNPSQCGPNSICNPSNVLNCDCLQGFQPKNPGNWAVREWGDGCVRKTELDCRNQTDGFQPISSAKLPDTSSAWADMSSGLGNCAAVCLNNCSCTAYASANVSSGIGCIFWTTDLRDVRVYDKGYQELYVRLAAADLVIVSLSASKKSHTKEVIIIISASVASLVVAIVITCFIRRRRINIRPFSQSNRGDAFDENEELELPLFDFKDISAATENFCNDMMLGKGGFGFVYRGILTDGKEIAVKRQSRTSSQGVDEFKNEVTLIAKLQHRNLVRLLGCCVHGEERMLVYEYMPNKSLDAFLFDKDNKISLTWERRHSIIMGIARGLLYLHQDSNFRIIHRDLKASNVLLDEQMNPKISDFGVARMLGGDDTMNMTRKVVGTYGYIAPEYAMSGLFSVKSDVFSFGVLVLEIISGERNKPFNHYMPQDNLLARAWSLWSQGRCLELVDPSIGPHDLEISQVTRCINVGLLCVQALPQDRPLMSTVVTMLVTDNLSLPEPKESGFLVTTRLNNELPSSLDNQEVHSVNYMSTTLVDAR